MLVATTDLLVEDVHFRRRWAEPADIGWKAIAVNVSDVAAMGATPRWALVALACPEAAGRDEVEAFYEGALALCDAYGVVIVGGDTSSSPTGWTVNVTLLGEAAAPVLRSTARPGDVIAVTGSLGRAAAGLAVLERDQAPPGVPAATLAELTEAHLRPRPRVAEGRWLAGAGGVTAMMDLSDGIATDLARLVAESGTAATVDLHHLPVADATREVAAALHHDPIAWATGGGEDYELLLTCEPAAFEGLAAGLARATGTRLTLNDRMLSALEAQHRKRDRPLPRRDERLALLPQGAVVWTDGEPTWALEGDAAAWVVLPRGAVGAEIEYALVDFARARLGRAGAVATRTLRTAGVTLGEVETRLAPWLGPGDGGDVAVTAVPTDGEVWVKLRARGATADSAAEALAAVERDVAHAASLEERRAVAGVVLVVIPGVAVAVGSLDIIRAEPAPAHQLARVRDQGVLDDGVGHPPHRQVERADTDEQQRGQQRARKQGQTQT